MQTQKPDSQDQPHLKVVKKKRMLYDPEFIYNIQKENRDLEKSLKYFNDFNIQCLKNWNNTLQAIITANDTIIALFRNKYVLDKNLTIVPPSKKE